MFLLTTLVVQQLSHCTLQATITDLSIYLCALPGPRIKLTGYPYPPFNVGVGPDFAHLLLDLSREAWLQYNSRKQTSLKQLLGAMLRP